MRFHTVLLALALIAGAVSAQTPAADPAALILESARQWEAQQRPDLARNALEKLLRSQPGHPAATRQLVLLEIRSGRIDAARQALEVLQKTHPQDVAVPELTAALRLATQDRLRLATARRLYETGRYDEAAQAMRELFPDGPPPGEYGLEYWKMISRSSGGAAQARAGLERMAQQFPDDPRYSAAAAELRPRESRPAPATPEPDLRALAAAAAAAGNTGEAQALLKKAVSRDPTFAWTRFDLAKLYQQQGRLDAARQIMDEGVRQAPADVEMRYAAALVYASLDDDDAALATLAAIPEREQTPKTREFKQDLQQTIARRLEASRRPQLTVPEIAATPVAPVPPRPAPVPDAPDARARAQAAADAGETLQAIQLLIGAVTRDPRFPWTRFDLAKLYQRSGRPDYARRTMDDGVRLAPDDPEMHYAAALVYSRLNDDAAALATLAAIPENAQTANTREMAARLKTQRAARRNGFVTAGPLFQEKPGSQGRSEYSAILVPMEWRQPWADDTYSVLHVDPVRLDAGVLPATYSEASLFGQVQAFGPASLANFPAGSSQTAEGVDLGLVYESPHWRLDVGSTPIGFAVTHVVGGVRWYDDLGPLSFQAGFARRPVTGSLLSYAGARDPASGKVWGGVVSNGFESALGYYGAGRFSGQLSAGAYVLTGQNVQDNPHQRVRFAVDWKLIALPSQEVSAGLAATYWHYTHDLSEYTYGHGGYYSPQSYRSLALPVEWRGRYQRLSYLLRASGSISRTRERAEDFYPNDPALQAMAQASPLPPGFTQPVYDAGTGGGLGYAFKGALEYRLDAHWFIGAHYQIERSDFFSPDTYGAYFRYDFDGRPDETPFPPRPPKSYLDY